MRTGTMAMSLMLMAASPAWAHFIFIIPDAAGQKATVVFSDKLAPDSAVDIGQIAGTKLAVKQRDAKDQPVAWAKGGHSFDFAIPGNGPRQIVGSGEYGVMQRGGSKPFLLVYHPKASVGDMANCEPLGESVPVEIVPVRAADGIRFKLLSRGKPRAEAEINIIAPGSSDSKKLKTDKDGLTPVFSAPGQYGAWAPLNEPKGGEWKGKKYDETRHYATFVGSLAG